MSHQYKELWDRVNQSRLKRGLNTLTWKQFVSKDKPALVKKYRQEFKEVVEPDPPKQFQRPPAVYSNQSVYEKYGL